METASPAQTNGQHEEERKRTAHPAFNENRAYRDEEFVRVEVAAGICLRSISYLNKKRCTGDGPPFMKIGGSVFYEVGQLRSWMRAHSRRSTSDQVQS